MIAKTDVEIIQTTDSTTDLPPKVTKMVKRKGSMNEGMISKEINYVTFHTTVTLTILFYSTLEFGNVTMVATIGIVLIKTYALQITNFFGRK